MLWHRRIQAEHVDLVREMTEFIIGKRGMELQVWFC
jgi:hypothetical protein